MALMAHTMCRVTYRSPEGQKRTFSFVSGDPFSKLDWNVLSCVYDFWTSGGKKSVARKFLDLFLPSVKMLVTKDWGEKNVKCFFFFFLWEKKLCVKSHRGKSGEFILWCFISRGNFYFSSMCATELKVLEGIKKKKVVGLCSKNN